MNKVIEYIIGAKDATGKAIKSALDRLKNFAFTVGRNLMNIQAGFQMFARAATHAMKLVTTAFKFETMTVQFRTLIGTLEGAKKHLKDLQELGDTPPFSLEQFAAASRSLIVLTQGALGFKESLKMIGDAAAATGQPLENLAHEIGRAFAFIRDGQSLSRALMGLVNIGVVTPEVMKRLQEMQDAGKSSVEVWGELEKSLRRFKDSMKQTEKTAEGLMGAIGSQKDDILREFGAALLDVSKGGLQLFLEKLKELRTSGAVEEWAKKARNAIYTVIGVFSGLSDEMTRERTWGAIKDVTVGAFQEAAHAAMNILIKGAQVIGKLIADTVSIEMPWGKDSHWNREVEMAKKMGYGDDIGFWDWTHDGKRGIEEVRRAIAEEDRESAKRLYGAEDGVSTSRLERGLNVLKELGRQAAKTREELVKLDEDKPNAKSIRPETKKDEEANIKKQLEDADKKRKEKEAIELAKKAAEEEEAARKKAEEAIAKERERLWRENLRAQRKELAQLRSEELTAQHRLADAQAKAVEAWGWYRNRDSWKAQLEEERANAAAEKQFAKDAERVTSKMHWRTAKLNDEDELIRRVVLAREEEAAAKEYAKQTAEATERAAETLEAIEERLSEGNYE